MKMKIQELPSKLSIIRLHQEWQIYMPSRTMQVRKVNKVGKAKADKWKGLCFA